MKHLYIYLITLTALLLASPAAFAQEEEEWEGIGTGAYQPGILDSYDDEFRDVVPAAVYESKTTPGKYKFVPTPPAEGLRMVYEIVVHTENPDKIWCEDAYFFYGIMNLTVRHLVEETRSGDYPENYGKMEDGAITFSTPESFMVITMTSPMASNINGKFALYLPGAQIPGSDPIVNDTWEVMGTGKYTEGFVDCEYEAGKTWDVEIEKSVEHPGCYRFKPYPEGNPSCPKLPEIADVYVYIHAENPMEVYTSDFTLLNSQGKGYKIQHRAVLPSSPDYSYYGTLEDNVITFPANSHIATIIGISGAGSMYTNEAGKAAVALPGSEYGDFYVKAVHPACAVAADEGFCKFPYRIEGGADVAAAGIIVEPGNITADNVDIEKYMKEGIQAYPKDLFNLDLNMHFPMVADQFGTNRWTMILVALDAEQKPHGFSLSTYFTPENDNNWEAYYNAEMTDIILSPGYFMGGTYDVLVEQRKGVPGFYRVVNPFDNHPSITGNDEYVKGHTDHKHYLYIHAEDPEYVYIEESSVGLDLGYGDVIASSAVGSLLNQSKTLEEIKSAGTPAGKMSDKEISFPSGALKFFETSYKNMVLQDCGNGVLLRLTEPASGIDNILTDDSPEAVYFDLQGFRVANPQKGGMYIMHKNGKASKVIF